jgi:CheY-like chemotaxis protein
MRKRSLVLLVDDNDAGRLLVRAVLQLAGFAANSDVQRSQLPSQLSPKPIPASITLPAADATTG